MFGSPQNWKRILFDLLALFLCLCLSLFLSSFFLSLSFPSPHSSLSFSSLFWPYVSHLFIPHLHLWLLQLLLSMPKKNLLQANWDIRQSYLCSLFTFPWLVEKNIVQFSLSCLLLVVIDTQFGTFLQKKKSDYSTMFLSWRRRRKRRSRSRRRSRKRKRRRRRNAIVSLSALKPPSSRSVWESQVRFFVASHLDSESSLGPRTRIHK